MNLVESSAYKGEELELPVGTILLNQMEYIIEVLMKFESESTVEGENYPRESRVLRD